MKKISGLIVGLSLISSLGLAQLNTGADAPGFTLTDSHGATQSLNSYRGKWVVLEWVNHQCPFVRKHYETGNMQKLQKKYMGQGVVWFSIASLAAGKKGPQKANDDLKANKANPTAVLLDPQGTVKTAYNATTTPHLFIINPQGKLVYQGAMDSKATTDHADVNAKDVEKYFENAMDAALAKRSIARATTKPYGCSIKD